MPFKGFKEYHDERNKKLFWLVIVKEKKVLDDKVAYFKLFPEEIVMCCDSEYQGILRRIIFAGKKSCSDSSKCNSHAEFKAV